MRKLTVLALASLMAAGAGPVVGQTPALEQALSRARAATPLPLSLTRDQADWQADHAELADDLDPDADVAARIEALTIQAERDRRIGRTVFPDPPVLGRECVITTLSDCSSSIGGYLELADSRLLWQVQAGFTDESGALGGVVFIGETVAAPMGSMAPVAWSFDAARFDPPILLAGSGFDGAAYVVVPGVRAGSGSGNADILFRWEPPHSDRLTQIDTWSWREDLAERLPPGLEILQGLRFDWPEMLAFTPLWQDGDAACCGTGGTAILSFQIEGDRLALVDVTVRDALIDTAASTPGDIFDFAGRWIGCAHWGGEEPYDAERRAEIARAETELRCAALLADRATLRLKYADDTRILGLIARVDAGEP